ncbi:MAG TPA: ABC transporter ATP-binding protein [Patescibacteria group bacterium]|nr:ABC transporter ATP-binding protein [Patescibacteria group bacterium]
MSKTKSTDYATIRLFWQTGLRHKKILWVAALHPIGAIFISVLAPLFVGKVIASLARVDGHPMQFVIYFVASAIIGVVCNFFGFRAVLHYQAAAMSDLQAKAMDVLLRRSVGFHNNNVGGKLVSDAIDFPAAFSLLSNAYFINLIPYAIILVFGSAVVFTQSWSLGLVVTLMAAFAFGSGIFESRRRAPLRSRRLKVSKAITGHMADTILNVQTVKTFAREDDELRKNAKLNRQLLELRLKDWGTAASQGNRRVAILFCLQLLFILLIIHLVQRDPHLLAIGIFAFTFSIMLSNRLFEVNTLLRNIEDGLLQAQPMTEIILQETEILDKPDAKPLKIKDGAITLQDMTFHYQDETAIQTVFDHLNLSIAPGEKIGLVGPSGGGKSTLTRLLLRFEDITGGVIAIDDQNIANVQQASLRKSISYVPQEPLLFHRSISENIAYGNPSVSAQKIKQAAHSAHADDFIVKLRDGYDTVVGERGVKLSGGQRQRVAIARAILKDAPILIFDEATSALDSESEVTIQDALWRLMEGRTAIVIAHRLSTIQKMDRILVLDEGKIVEQGTHKQLLKQKGLYAKLWTHQSGGFIEE